MIHSGISEEIRMGKLDVEDGEGYSFVSLLNKFEALDRTIQDLGETVSALQISVDAQTQKQVWRNLTLPAIGKSEESTEQAYTYYVSRRGQAEEDLKQKLATMEQKRDDLRDDVRELKEESHDAKQAFIDYLPSQFVDKVKKPRISRQIETLLRQPWLATLRQLGHVVLHLS
ncbi:MAG: hypothetical protein Q9221_002070 [Calogaya cf. arnoldii]